MKQYIISIDLGGTTFSSYIIDNNLNIHSRSLIEEINQYSGTVALIDGIERQVLDLVEKNNISLNEILCLGISAPGPLDSKMGTILDTPNLIILQNTPIVSLLNEKFNFPIFIENDANLFALGEWFNHYKDSDIVVGITLGTGLGLGVVINGKLFLGAHGMGTEYGISPYKSGVWEDIISIEGLESLCKQSMNKMSPKELYELASEDNFEALQIWNEFGENLGIFTSHILNLLDPSVVIYGGGVSGAYKYFSRSLIKKLKQFSPTYTYNNTLITYSKLQLDSSHIGAAKFALEKIKK